MSEKKDSKLHNLAQLEARLIVLDSRLDAIDDTIERLELGLLSERKRNANLQGRIKQMREDREFEQEEEEKQPKKEEEAKIYKIGEPILLNRGE